MSSQTSYSKPFSTLTNSGTANSGIFPYIQASGGSLDSVTIGAGVPALSISVGNITLAGNTISATLGSLTLDPPVLWLGNEVYPSTTPFGLLFQDQFAGVTANTFTYTVNGVPGPATFSALAIGGAPPLTASGSTLVLPVGTACYLPTVEFVSQAAGTVFDLDTAVVSTFLSISGTGNVTGTMQPGPYSGYIKVVTVNSVQAPANMYLLAFPPGTLLDPGTGAKSLATRTMSFTCGMSVQLTWSAPDACWFVCNTGVYLS